MRFRIVNQNRKQQKNQKQEDKDTQTRQSSGSKFKQNNSFMQMVKNNYDFYLSMGKDKIRQQQKKVAVEKEQKIKKMIKKQKIKQERMLKQIVQQEKNQSYEQKQKRITNRKTYLIKRQERIKSSPIRKSQRNRKLVNYNEVQKVNTDQIFNVLSLESQQQNHNGIEVNKKIQVLKMVNQNSQNSQNQFNLQANLQTKTISVFEKFQKLKAQNILKVEGTYQIGVAHQALLRTQKCIDEHLNFKHQIRQSNSLQFSQLIKYLRSHGFSMFGEKQFETLYKINPYLYSFTQGSTISNLYIMTFKLTGYQIQRRLQSTRRRMTQICMPQLLT